jgi:hypothetical protein
MCLLSKMAQIVKYPSIACLLMFSSANLRQAYAQEVDEVMLTFAFPAVGQVYVNTVFKDDAPFIATAELLSLLYIPYQNSKNGLGYEGVYPTADNRWEINPGNLTYTVGETKKPLHPTLFHKTETDIYLSPSLFKEIFGLDLIVNAYGLMLSLRSERILPVEELRKRQQIRQELKQTAPENVLKNYPMFYPRNRKLLGFGMFDYNLGINRFEQSTEYLLGTSMGVELLGGDFQTAFSAYRISDRQLSRFSNSRWRYVFKGGLDPNGNNLISELTVGQLNLGGPEGGFVRGISISNTPLVPRRVLDIFAIEGFTTPDSEVELLIAGQLVDFTRADELGYYRFSTPLTYGTIRVGLRIYTPQGEVIFEDRQLQIPFTFLPRGVVNYNVQAGLQELLSDSTTTLPVGHGDLAYGINNNVTLRLGSSYGLDSTGTAIRPYGSLNFRVFDQYLFNVEAQPDQFIRSSGSVFYANNNTINVQYTQFIGRTSLNRRGEEEILNLNYFLPFNLGKQASGLRFGLDRIWYGNRQEYQYQIDLNTRIGPFITRLNFREDFDRRIEEASTIQRLATAAITYSVPRTPGVPAIVRGMFFRVQLRHDTKRFDASALASLQFSQTLFKKGRLTAGYDYDINVKSNMFQLGFLYDFNGMRSSTRAQYRQEGKVFIPTVNQSFTGSLGADFKNGTVIPTNRDQVGRSGASIRLFIDDNGNGKFDKGEEIVPAKAVRLNQSSSMLIGSDGILRITQLQSYWTYLITVDQNLLPDPTLAPIQAKFAFVADPNRYKNIDIALYRTGSIEGTVYREKNVGSKEPQPGLRLVLQKEGDEAPLEPVRTLSDGSFYAYNLIPGKYTLLVDSNQLRFMKVQMEPDTFRFAIKPTAEGDYIDNIELLLVPAKDDSTKKDEGMTLAQLEYMLGEQLRQSVGAFVTAQEHFYQGKYQESLHLVDSSLNIFESDFGLALKGSVVFVIGNKADGRRYWQMAREKNPFVVIPDSTSIRPRKDSIFSTNEQFVTLPLPEVRDSAEQVKAEFLARLENQLSDKLAQSVALFVEAQEYFYRRQFVEAGISLDSSLNLFVTDHGLALKGSIAYITGKKAEARRLWEEARYRNPLISLPDTEILDRMIKPITVTSNRNARKQPVTN